MSYLVVVAPLKADMAERARELLVEGPPFDLEGTVFDRHSVHLTDREVVFVFEASTPGAVERLVSDETLWEALGGWSELAAGPPRLAEDVYSWIRAHASEDISFTPTPGPGDSEGGDVFAPPVG